MRVERGSWEETFLGRDQTGGVYFYMAWTYNINIEQYVNCSGCDFTMRGRACRFWEIVRVVTSGFRANDGDELKATCSLANCWYYH